MSAAAPVPARRAAASGPLLPRTLARLIGYLLLGGAGALSWGGIVVPARGWALLGFTVVAAACGVGLALSRDLRRPARAALGLGLAVLLAGLGLLAAGVPLRYLGPGAWDELVRGISMGAEAAPAITVPYAGTDPWARIVVLLGAPALLALAALLSFWPRRDGGLGYPISAAVALGAASAVPAVQVPGDAPLVEGAVLAVLLITFLGLERVPRRAAPLAAGLVAAATVAGVLVAPALDAEEPLIDYEEIAQSLTPEVGERFAWNHEYGPIDWPRDGAEVLRVKAERGTYWKATALSVFNGLRWERRERAQRQGIETEIDRTRPEWRTRMRFTIRGMTTEEFIGAGTVLSVSQSPRQPVISGPGEFRVEDRPLRSGHTYDIEAYVPRPGVRALSSAGTRYPSFLADDLTMELPPEERGRQRPEVRFAPFGSDQATLATVDGRVVTGDRAEAVVARSAYGRVYRLAQELKADATTPYAFVRAVERHLAQDFTYSEIPPERRVPLDGFLFVDRAGYCQQFSGAMALLLRMGGVPARVATGFSPGEFDEERGEYIVRDTDAHSWVEVYSPQTGWVAFDPTPSEAPARSRTLGTTPAVPRDAPADPGPAPERDLEPEPVGPIEAAPAEEDRGVMVPLVLAFGVAFAVSAVSLGMLMGRRRERDRAPVQFALDDLDRAMRRIGRPLPPRTTLGALAERFDGTPGEPYLRALEGARYGADGGADGPTGRDRAGLRRMLAARAGAFGRLKAWWALPPG